MDDDTACGNHGSVADGNAGADDHTGGQPDMVPDVNGLGVAGGKGPAVGVPHSGPFFGHQGVQGRDKRDVGSCLKMVPDGHRGIVLDDEVHIGEKVVSNGGMAAIVEPEGTVEPGISANPSHDFPKQSLTPGIFLHAGVQTLTKVMAGALYGRKLRIPGGKEHAGQSFFFFLHWEHPP